VSVIDSLYAVTQTLRISLPTMVEAAVGRVSLDTCDERLAEWSEKLVVRAEIDLQVHGPTPDWSRAYVIMSNHQSHYDIPVLFRVMPRHARMRMITKTELFRIPVFGRAMRGAGFVEIDRSNRDKAIASLRDAAEKIRTGTNIWIAPEGTRSRDGVIGPLKKGGFLLARDTATPILPVALRGTIDVLPKGARALARGRRVDVTFGAPIAVDGVPVDTLMDAVRAFLVAHTRR
jgi:1-acyl-sn-glycerol-3-phosphate acyltransferase